MKGNRRDAVWPLARVDARLRHCLPERNPKTTNEGTDGRTQRPHPRSRRRPWNFNEAHPVPLYPAVLRRAALVRLPFGGLGHSGQGCSSIFDCASASDPIAGGRSRTTLERSVSASDVSEITSSCLGLRLLVPSGVGPANGVGGVRWSQWQAGVSAAIFVFQCSQGPSIVGSGWGRKAQTTLRNCFSSGVTSRPTAVVETTLSSPFIRPDASRDGSCGCLQSTGRPYSSQPPSCRPCAALDQTGKASAPMAVVRASLKAPSRLGRR